MSITTWCLYLLPPHNPLHTIMNRDDPIFLGSWQIFVGTKFKKLWYCNGFPRKCATFFTGKKKHDGGLQGLPKTRLNLSAGGGSTRYSQTSMVRTSGTNKQINKQKRHWTCDSEKCWGHLQTNPCIITFDFDSNCRYTNVFHWNYRSILQRKFDVVSIWVGCSATVILKIGIFSKLEFPHFL